MSRLRRFFLFFFGYEIIRYNHQNDIMIYNHEYDTYTLKYSVQRKLNYFIKKNFFLYLHNKTFSYKDESN